MKYHYAADLDPADSVVLASDVDALAAELARCRAAIAHDTQATRRIADLEAELAMVKEQYASYREAAGASIGADLNQQAIERISVLEAQLHCPAHPTIAVSCPVCHWIPPSAAETPAEAAARKEWRDSLKSSSETAVKPAPWPPTFTGWISGACENCGMPVKIQIRPHFAHDRQAETK